MNFKNKFYDLDLSWINNVQVNLSAVERRTSSLVKRRSVKKRISSCMVIKSSNFNRFNNA